MKKLTVLCPAYNQAPYIEKTLTGFVNQITGFDFTILVGDDASTDGTSDIIRRYATEYPTRVIPLIRPQNMGGMANGRELWSRVDTEYVIICEGDDYWLDDRFLQKGVDFLDSHPECPMFCANSLVHDLARGEVKRMIDQESGGWFSLATDHLLFAHTSARLMRYLPRRLMFDVFLFYYYASRGPCYFQNEIVSVYNLTGQGYWSSLADKTKRRYNLATLATLNKLFDYHYDRHFTAAILTGTRGAKFWKGLKHLMPPTSFWRLYRRLTNFPEDIELFWSDELEGQN